MITEILAKAAEVAAESVKEVGAKMSEGFEKIKPGKEMSTKEITGSVKEIYNKGISKSFEEHIGDGLDKQKIKNDSLQFKEIKKEDSSTEKKKEFASHSKGSWKGEPGNSTFNPENVEAKKIIEKHGEKGIEYKNGEPDFSKVSKDTVEIKDMTSDRPSNFRQANEELAQKWNNSGEGGRKDWTARDVDNWRKDNNYSWHERSDMKTMDLVPRSVHEECKHYGGVSECKKLEAKAGGFDD